MRTLIVEYGGDGRGPFDVVDEYGRRCNGLCMGEMLEQVVGLTVQGQARYQMLTEDEWAERARQAEARRQEARAPTATRRHALLTSFPGEPSSVARFFSSLPALMRSPDAPGQYGRQPFFFTTTGATMPKKPKAAAAVALQITEPCDRDQEGYGALPFVQCDRESMTITRAEISAAKATLLEAGFESNEIEIGPDADIPAEPGWLLVAVLATEGESAAAVAILARPAGMADQAPDGKPWPFPHTEGGGPDAQSDPQPAPAMSKTEAHLGRKSAQFEILQPTDALLRTFTPRVEKHGEDDVSAASLGLSIEAPNTILDLLSPSLRPTLYAAPEGQVTLPGVEESTPLLRTKVIETLKLSNCYEGWLLRISRGFDGDIDISGCKVDKFVVTPRDGGSVQLDLRIGSSDISEEEAGWLYGKLRHDIEITLHAPAPKPEAIDGSTEAFERDHPIDERDAGDLFAEEHGGSDDGADEQRQQDEAVGEEA